MEPEKHLELTMDDLLEYERQAREGNPDSEETKIVLEIIRLAKVGAGILAFHLHFPTP